VGLVARHLEGAGIPTVCLANAPVPTQRVRPPRVLMVGAPRGATVGPAGDRAAQAAVVRAALGLLQRPLGPGAVVAFDPAGAPS
jgi:D-proline reductase (dithiol) PrdB